MSQPVIALAGFPRAGKTAIATHLSEQYGAWAYPVSSTLITILKTLGVEQTRPNLTQLAMSIIKAFGHEAILSQTCRLVGANLQTDEEAREGRSPFPPLLVIDGIRFVEHVKIVRREFPGCKLLGVWAPPATRCHRRNALLDEKSGGAKLSLEKFLAQDDLPTERHIGDVLKLADVTIDNTGTITELHAAVDTLMAKWGIAPR